MRKHFLLCGTLLGILALTFAACERRPAQSPQSTANTSSSTSDATTSTNSGAASQPAGDMGEVSGNAIMVQGVAFSVPETWVKETPSSSMRIAQYRIDGDAGPVSVVFSSFGGDVQMNIQRWLTQFKDATGPGGEGTPSITKEKVGEMDVATVRVEGTYAPGSMGPMVPAAEPEDGQALYGVIITGGPGGTIFIKSTGPAETVNAHADELASLAKNMAVH